MRLPDTCNRSIATHCIVQTGRNLAGYMHTPTGVSLTLAGSRPSLPRLCLFYGNFNFFLLVEKLLLFF